MLLANVPRARPYSLVPCGQANSLLAERQYLPVIQPMNRSRSTSSPPHNSYSIFIKIPLPSSLVPSLIVCMHEMETTLDYKHNEVQGPVPAGRICAACLLTVKYKRSAGFRSNSLSAHHKVS